MIILASTKEIQYSIVLITVPERAVAVHYGSLGVLGVSSALYASCIMSHLQKLIVAPTGSRR